MSSWESFSPDSSLTYAQDSFCVVEGLFFIDKSQLKPTQNEHTWAAKRTSSHEAENWHNSDKSVESIYVYLFSSPTAEH